MLSSVWSGVIDARDAKNKHSASVEVVFTGECGGCANFPCIVTCERK
jgi:hypothetical protein